MCLSVSGDFLEEICNLKFCVKLEKTSTKTLQLLKTSERDQTCDDSIYGSCTTQLCQFVSLVPKIKKTAVKSVSKGKKRTLKESRTNKL